VHVPQPDSPGIHLARPVHAELADEIGVDAGPVAVEDVAHRHHLGEPRRVALHRPRGVWLHDAYDSARFSNGGFSNAEFSDAWSSAAGFGPAVFGIALSRLIHRRHQDSGAGPTHCDFQYCLSSRSGLSGLVE